MQLWGRPLIPVAVCLMIALFVWPVLGATGSLLLLSLSLLAIIIRHVHRLTLLMDWLPNASVDNVPSPPGHWEEVFAALYRFLRQQTQIQSRLSNALGRFERASAAMPDGVILLDKSGHIEWLNPKAAAYLSLELGRDRSQQITNIVRQPQFVDYLQQQDPAGPLTLRVWQGAMEQVLSIQATPYGDQKRLVLCRDITQIEQVETVRRDFVANVSHEIRTPLTVITGFLETLLDLQKPDPEMSRRSLQLMSEQAARMLELVEDLLTLSRLESAGNPLKEDIVDVPNIIRGVYKEAQSISGGRHRLSLHIDSNNGLKGNAAELRSVFSNLMTNALRYTPEAGEVTVIWEDKEAQPVFTVKDNGIGIDPKYIPRLTERFFRVDRARSRASGGTGLGLAIVKHILNRHQGELRVQSTLGRGSQFCAVFPAARSVVIQADTGAHAVSTH
jgi:two-component system, OmpR family, phosphate regulon sensor histidine kinase PhoR